MGYKETAPCYKKDCTSTVNDIDIKLLIVSIAFSSMLMSAVIFKPWSVRYNAVDNSTTSVVIESTDNFSVEYEKEKD